MGLIAPNEGESLMIGYIVNKTAQTNLTLHLYTNNYTPIETSTFDDFDEPTDPAYAPKILIGSSWTITESTITTGSYPKQTFNFNEAATVYGYFVSNGSKTLFAERFEDEAVLPVDGGQIGITLNLTIS